MSNQLKAAVVRVIDDLETKRDLSLEESDHRTANALQYAANELRKALTDG